MKEVRPLAPETGFELACERRAVACRLIALGPARPAPAQTGRAVTDHRGRLRISSGSESRKTVKTERAWAADWILTAGGAKSGTAALWTQTGAGPQMLRLRFKLLDMPYKNMNATCARAAANLLPCPCSLTRQPEARCFQRTTAVLSARRR